MERNLRKAITAVVENVSGLKTIRVKVVRRIIDPKYKKIIKRSKTILVHDEENICKVGDLVEIMETRPLSKTKNWRLVKIKEKQDQKMLNLITNLTKEEKEEVVE